MNPSSTTFSASWSWAKDNLSLLQFAHELTGDDNSTHLIGRLWDWNAIIHQSSQQGEWHKEHWVNIQSTVSAVTGPITIMFICFYCHHHNCIYFGRRHYSSLYLQWFLWELCFHLTHYMRPWSLVNQVPNSLPGNWGPFSFVFNQGSSASPPTIISHALSSHSPEFSPHITSMLLLSQVSTQHRMFSFLNVVKYVVLLSCASH